ncbi:outer membrane beta-barrel protein [Bartonella sp. AP58NXGY]|uniref:outer membrane protein n=1 Tax=Bartonella sp. AP58NXGY TaxID=3243498 RepID=UPI0035D0FF70
MNTKRLITASIFSLISASTALAADVLIPHQPASSTSSAIVAPTFSWTGLYLGVQAGGFSSKADMALIDQEKNFSLDKEFSPKLSGFAGGFYAGSNIDLGDSFVFGIDTDLMLSGKKHTKTITIGASNNATVENAVGRARRSAETQTLSTPQASTLGNASGQPAAILPKQAESEKSTPATSAETPPAEPTATQSSQTQDGQMALVQQSNAGAGQSNHSATTGSSSTISLKTQSASSKTETVSDTRGTSVSEVSGSQPGVPTQVSSSTETGKPQQSQPLLLARSSVGGEAVEVGTRGSSVPAQPVVTKATLSVPSTESSKQAAKTPTSVESSLAERTIPSAPLVLARSGLSGTDPKTSNGTNGAHSRVSSNGTGGGHVHPHGASHGGGHSSVAYSHGSRPHASYPHGGQNMAGHGAQSPQVADKSNSSVYGIEQIKKVASELALDQEDEVEALNHTFKQNWGGATRVRIGFAADRFMPYLAGGIAYGQFQDTVSISVKGEDGSVVSSKNLTDETKTMIGYTLGGGIDFAMLDNVIVRAEYRYSDFGKKKFAKEKLEVNYKTNDFRVGVAYKF